MIVAMLALAFAGFAALCLGVERHHQDILGRRPVPAWRLRVLRIAGWALLASALACSVADGGWGPGSVTWLGGLTATGLLLVYGLLPYRPRWIVPAATAAPVLAVIALATSQAIAARPVASFEQTAETRFQAGDRRNPGGSAADHGMQRIHAAPAATSTSITPPLRSVQRSP